MRERWKKWTLRLSPPGYDPSIELAWLAVGAIVALVVCLSVFSGNLQEGLDGLELAEKYGYGGPEMPRFEEALAWGPWGFLLAAAAALLLIPVRAGYWYQGSRSIYLMRRLPRKNELWLRTIALPLLTAAALLVLLAVAVLGCWVVYNLAVPADKLPEGQWAVFWAAQTGGR